MMFVRTICIAVALIFTAPLISVVCQPEIAEARSFKGGRMFKSTPPAYRAPAQKQQPGAAPQQAAPTKPGGFGRGLAGGLLGGAMGALLFGSLFGMGGHGIGLLPILLLAGVAFFLYRSYSRSKSPAHATVAPAGAGGSRINTDFTIGGGAASPPPPPQQARTVNDGLAEIRRTDPGFDEHYFLEVASDVFFRIQAGWSGRDLSVYRHLLGEQLAAEYESHFQAMRDAGTINRLENIAIRSVELAAAGSQQGEDFVTVLFTATLLDYTVDEKTGDVIEGSRTNPVKFAEHWTWARPVGSENWRLEGIDVVDERLL